MNASCADRKLTCALPLEFRGARRFKLAIVASYASYIHVRSDLGVNRRNCFDEPLRDLKGKDQNVVPQRLPEAEEVNGVYYDPQTETVRLQYLSKGKAYELSMPLEEALKAEEWFIKIREQLGAHTRQFRDRGPA